MMLRKRRIGNERDGRKWEEMKGSGRE